MNTKIKPFILSIALATALLIFLVLPSSGQAKEDNGWSFNLSPFAFALGLEGDVATLPGAAPAEVDVSFGDILDELDIAFMVVGEARKGRFAILGELYYSEISTDASTPGSFYSGADYDQTLFFVSVATSYRFVEKNHYYLDMLAGLRYWHIDNELDIDAGLMPAKRLSDKEGWFDPIFGIEGSCELFSNFYTTGWAVAAAGGESDSVFDVFGGVGYRFNDLFSLIVGYRHQSVDYDNGNFLFDVEFSCPIIGTSFRF